MAKIEDEKIIVALMTHRTIREAAESIGITDRTIYARMRNVEFEQAYKCARTDLLRASVAEIGTRVQDALTVISDIMHSEDASAQVRLNAASMLLNYSEKAQDRLRAEEVANMPAPPLADVMLDF